MNLITQTCLIKRMKIVCLCFIMKNKNYASVVISNELKLSNGR